jgi:hypothetical protein
VCAVSFAVLPCLGIGTVFGLDFDLNWGKIGTEII